MLILKPPISDSCSREEGSSIQEDDEHMGHWILLRRHFLSILSDRQFQKDFSRFPISDHKSNFLLQACPELEEKGYPLDW